MWFTLNGRRVYELKPETVIGRSRSCDIRLTLPDVSREHCLIRQHDGKLHIVDMGSRNGTHVNGKNVQETGPVPLSNGDEVRIGGFVLKVAVEVN